ncbi:MULTISPECIES: hypothetical protein [unclassified Schlesneria]|uniref:hypothetical protein n=1 Tax=Schlesneria TaxID=656899 RepID=UPI002EECA526
MNYFAHALNHLHEPYLMAATGVPDWLSAADRKVRLRPRHVEPWLASNDDVQSAVAAGVLQHLHDDDWFHATRGFVEVTSELTRMFRENLGPDEKYHCNFLGHVGMELILDGVLMDQYNVQFEDYWRLLDDVDPAQIEVAVNRMARTPTERLAWFIEVYRREQFLRGYESDLTLLLLLNQVLMRVKLSPIPTDASEVITAGRDLVRLRLRDLLPADRFTLP